MPPNPQNLRPPFPKGVSGNPKGRPPRGRAFEDLVDLIDETPGALRAISKVWLKQILNGNLAALREYLDRSDGKPTPIVEAQDDDETDNLGILVRVPTVRQAERMARAKRKSLEKPKPKPGKGKAAGNGSTRA